MKNMFFGTLLLAHVIGDFPLQTDAIFRLKTKYPWGVLPHVFICTIMNILALYPYWSNKYAWMAVAFLAIVHTVLDRTKLTVTEKIAKDNFFQFLIDQLLHIFSIWLTAFWLSQMIDPSDYQVVGPLADQQVIIQLTALIFAAFGGVPIIYYAKKYVASFKHSEANNGQTAYPSFLKRIPGYFERFLATLCIIWGGWWLFLAVGAFLPRLLVNWRDENKALLFANIIIGIAISMLCGLFVIIMA